MPFKHNTRRRTPPKPRLGGIVDLGWSGHLARTGDTITAELADTHGWRLAFTVTSHHDGTHLVLRGRVAKAGPDMPPWSDDGLRSSLMDYITPGLPGVDAMPVPGVLQLREGAWAGWVGATEAGGSIKITATGDEPERLVLVGVG